MAIAKFLAWFLLLYGVAGLLARYLYPERYSSRDDSGSGKGRKPFRLPLYRPFLVTGIISVVLLSLIVVITAQEVGVVVTPKGVRSDELHTGWHTVMPWNDVFRMDKTVWVYTCAQATQEGAKPNADAVWAPTKDGIKMGFDVSVSWRINADEASWIYSNVSENDGGDDGRYLWLEENVIRPKLKSALALTVSNFTPIEVYSTKRQEIQNEVIDRIRQEIAPFKLILEQVDLREVYYNPEYETAINNKKLAEQEALRLFEVTKQQEELKKQEAIKKDIAILKAEGESKALQIKGQSISNNPKIIDLEWINKWNGQLPVYMLGSGQGVLLNLPGNK
jgi:regulator of protease activity HflC (stomatin/prohibitin superfamily)